MCRVLGVAGLIPKSGQNSIPLPQVAKEQQCARLQLSVLDWNTPSMDFYIAKGAQDLTKSEGWHFLRFDGEALDKLAAEAPRK